MTPSFGRISTRARISEILRRLQWFRYSTDYNKFVIIGQARSGTTYLQTSLDSHPRIVSRGEVFNLPSKSKHALHELVSDPVAYIDKRIFRPFPDRVGAVGFKMVYDQIGEDNLSAQKFEAGDRSEHIKIKLDALYRYLQENYDVEEVKQRLAGFLIHLKNDPTIRIIHAKRRNKLETLVSEKLARRTGVWNSTQGAYGSGLIRIDREECMAFFQTVDALERHYAALFRHHPMVEVYYETAIADPESTLGTIQDFLGVERQTLTTPLEKQNRRTPQEVVENYSELQDYFKHTEWAWCFGH